MGHAMVTDDARVPVTLLTGFLGAGKTTLLNHLLKDPQAGHIAVIINEFGDVGLDHDLIEASTEETILLDSGCLCCAIRGDLATTMASLMHRRKAGALAYDRVVIETTGIADPGPVLHTLVVSDIIAPDYRMDGVVTLADAAAGAGTLDQHFEATHQIAVADLIVLTKTDLVSPSELADFEHRIGALNASAQRLVAERGWVPPGALFGLSALRPEARSDEIAPWLGDPHHHDDHHHHNHHHHHHDRIATASIMVHDPIPANVFDFWLEMLLALKGPDILRIKGIVFVEGAEVPFVFHGVQHIFDAPVPLISWSGTDTTSRVVVIARDMTRAELLASLQTLQMRERAPDAEDMIVHTEPLSL